VKSRSTDTVANASFPIPPITGSESLVPITSWPEMYRETTTTGAEFDEFWYESVEDRVAYFFRWLGEPRCTILAVWDDRGLTHVECRKAGDVVVSETESVPIIAVLTNAFQNAGLGSVPSTRQH